MSRPSFTRCNRACDFVLNGKNYFGLRSYLSHQRGERNLVGFTAERSLVSGTVGRRVKVQTLDPVEAMQESAVDLLPEALRTGLKAAFPMRRSTGRHRRCGLLRGREFRATWDL